MPYSNNKAWQIYEDKRELRLERHGGNRQLRKCRLRGRHGALELIYGKIQSKSVPYPSCRSRGQADRNHDDRKSERLEPADKSTFQQTDSLSSLRPGTADDDETAPTCRMPCTFAAQFTRLKLLGKIFSLDRPLRAPNFRHRTGCGTSRMEAGSGLAYSKAMDELI